jgi:hypothetical protein
MKTNRCNECNINCPNKNKHVIGYKRELIYGQKSAKVWHHQTGHKIEKNILRQNDGIMVLVRKYKSTYWLVRLIYNDIHTIKKGLEDRKADRIFEGFLYLATIPYSFLDKVIYEGIREKFGWSPNPYIEKVNGVWQPKAGTIEVIN